MAVRAMLESVYTYATAVQTAGSMYELVGGRIYFGSAPQGRDDAPYPFIVISNEGAGQDEDFSGSQDTMQVRFSVYSRGYHDEDQDPIQAIDIMDAISARFDWATGLSPTGMTAQSFAPLNRIGPVQIDDQYVGAVEFLYTAYESD